MYYRCTSIAILPILPNIELVGLVLAAVEEDSLTSYNHKDEAQPCFPAYPSTSGNWFLGNHLSSEPPVHEELPDLLGP
jgi:hypothetical protein